jgi:uncharacterized membrane protein/Mg-chelatase subunit ChlD
MLMPFSITFQEPLWLLLLAVVPVVWILSRRSMGALGGWRSSLANSLRSLVLIGVIMALASPQWIRFSENVSVAYLLDQSESIPAEYRGQMLRYVTNNVERHRQGAKGDRAAVIVFGREAAVEVPPVEFAPGGRNIESEIDPTATNLADSLAKAVALLPNSSARRVVVVTDGNENVGAAARQSQQLVQAGIGVDVIPMPTGGKQDVAVESVAAPSAAKKDQPLEVRVVLNNQGDDPRPAKGKLRIVRKSGGTEETIAEEAMTLPAGKSVFSFRETPTESDFYVYEARFIPDELREDRFLANNLATGFTDVRGKGRVLLLEDYQHAGEFDALVESLRNEGIETEVMASDRAFSSLADLQRYDSVILANVPRVAGDAAGSFVSLTDEQIGMLVQNTKELGCGLVMIGGERSYGAGGWAGSELEKAMPVDFQIKNAKVIPVGALGLVIDRSGSMAGEKLDLCLVAAREAIKMMGPRDFINVVAFDDMAYNIVPLERVGNGGNALARTSRIAIGGGTNLFPGMQMGYEQLKKADAAVKHMIVLTDGMTPEAEFAALCRQMRQDKITVSAVAVGPDADRALLARIASMGKGKFYAAPNPRAVPRIFMVETRRIATPVIRELSPARTPLRIADHQMLTGIEGEFPPLAGFVQTTVKENSLVEVLLRSPEPALEKNATVLATWTYGLGKSAALTTDAGSLWAASWKDWENYEKFFSQLVRWSMRPSGEQGNYSVTTQTDGGRTQIVVDALDDEGEFVNELNLYGSVVGPELKPIPLAMEQTAPGRYTGEFPSADPGSYFVTVSTPSGAMLRAGVNVGASREYSDFTVNMPLLERLASSAPRGGEPGKIASVEGELPFATEAGSKLAEELDPFRRDLPPAITSRDMWPPLVVAACVVFLSDIFIRRVQLDFTAMRARVSAWVTRRKVVSAPATLARLSAKKAEIRERYQAPAVESAPAIDPQAVVAKPPAAVKTKAPDKQEPAEEETMTGRLLAAKKAMKDNRWRRD